MAHMRCPLFLAGLIVASCAGGQDLPPASPPPAPVATTPPPPVLEPAAPPGQPPPAQPLTLEERAARLHREAIVVDTHNDITSAMLEDGFDLGAPNGKTATDLPRMRAGGITAEFFSIYVDKR
jgi:hypothetical protein